jgi:hypothetical protein
LAEQADGPTSRYGRRAAGGYAARCPWRRLFGRWASQATHPHERPAGLLALLHAASSAQIRNLTIGDINVSGRILALTSILHGCDVLV